MFLMAQISIDNAYRLWEYTAQEDWEGIRSALQIEDVWDEFGDEEAEELLRVLNEIEAEQVSYPENVEELYTMLNQYLGE
jgi:hypothetical protein